MGTPPDMIDYMSANLDKQDLPYVGIFWYDPKKDELFGVVREEPDELMYNAEGNRTTKVLHKGFWQKQYHKAQSLGRATRFVGDFTQMPRGRVWQNKDKGFFVTVGEWIKKYPQAKDFVIIEFNLPNETEFKVYEHWNIGSGWDGDTLR